MIKHRTYGHGPSIDEVEIVRETAASVFYTRTNGTERKAAKRSDYENYHDTWVDAHQFLIDRATAKVASARRSLESANGELGNIKGMRNPAATVTA